jgi:hypothetical protein
MNHDKKREAHNEFAAWCRMFHETSVKEKENLKQQLLHKQKVASAAEKATKLRLQAHEAELLAQEELRTFEENFQQKYTAPEDGSSGSKKSVKVGLKKKREADCSGNMTNDESVGVDEAAAGGGTTSKVMINKKPKINDRTSKREEKEEVVAVATEEPDEEDEEEEMRRVLKSINKYIGSTKASVMPMRFSTFTDLNMDSATPITVERFNKKEPITMGEKKTVKGGWDKHKKRILDRCEVAGRIMTFNDFKKHNTTHIKNLKNKMELWRDYNEVWDVMCGAVLKRIHLPKEDGEKSKKSVKKTAQSVAAVEAAEAEEGDEEEEEEAAGGGAAGAGAAGDADEAATDEAATTADATEGEEAESSVESE